ncbi:MAG: PQQ-like beta-propeller repeat protein [Spirochaetes bacterium]|nr:PQQ-like beta-propeller repeat protein [Spirochaetota bacterium]
MKKSITLIVSLLLTALFLNCDTNKKDDKNKLLSLLLFLQPNFTGDAVWARSVSAGTSESGIKSVSIGSDGIYAAGIINSNSTYTFGTQNVTGISSNSYNPVLVKYDTAGNAIWAKSISDGPASDQESLFNCVKAGSDGIYAVGIIQSTTNYKFGTVNVAGMYSGSNVVIVKYDTNGNAIWAKSVSAGLNSSEFNSVTIGSDGIYAAGTIWGNTEYKFGDQSVTGKWAAHKNAVIVKYDTNGNAIWAKSVTTGPNRSGFNAVSAGSDGIYAAGFIRGTVAFSFDSQSVLGTYSSFNTVLVKYDTSGNALWAKSVSAGSNDSYLNSVSVGSDGIYAAGYINNTGTYTFGTQSVNGTFSGFNAVLVKYNTSGDAVWAKSVAAGSSNSIINSVFAGSDGVYAARQIMGTTAFTFGTKSVTGTTIEDNPVLVKYDTSGNALWAKSISAGSAKSYFYGVVSGPMGLFAGGQISDTGTYTFGTQSVNGTAALELNSVLVKYQ